MATDRIRIMLSAAVAMTAAEANAIGVPPGQLIEADLSRLRAMAADALPALTETERGAIGFVLAGLEFHRLTTGDLSLPSGATLAAELVEMADGRPYDEVLMLEGLARRARDWSPLAILGLVIEARR